MLKKLLFALLILANFSAYSQFPNSIAASKLPTTEGMILDVVDYNNDGFEDVVYQNRLSGTLELYKNTNGVFSNATSSALLPIIAGSGAGNEGVISFDYDNDGFQDLLIMASGPSGYMRLFKNNCGVNFTEVSSAMNMPVSPSLVGQFLTNDPLVVIMDYDKDRDNDIVFCRLHDGEYWISALRNNGAAFSVPSDLVTSFGASVIPNMAVLDYDNDNDEDILVIKNTGVSSASQIDLYDNSGSGNFSVITSPTGLSNSSPIAFANIFDLNNDGFLDILLGTKEVVNPGPGNLGLKVFRNNGGSSTFTDITATYNTYANAITTDTGDYYASHVFDINNDGDNDVLWEINRNNQTTSRPAMMSNSGFNTFTNIRSTVFGGNLTTTNATTKYFIFDYNNDGAMDIFVPGTALSTNARLLRNTNTTNNYLSIRLMSCVNQADPIGAKVYVRAGLLRLYRNYNGQGLSSTTSGKSERLHFGLGNNTVIDTLRIIWPNGLVDEQYAVNSNQNLTIMDGSCGIGQPLVFDLGPDTANVCNQDTALLFATGSFVTYNWSTGDTTPDTKVSQKGWYYCTVTNLEGCSATDSIYAAFGIGRVVQNDTTICLGTSLQLDAFPRYDCSPFGAPVKRVVNAGDNLGPALTYVNSLNGHHYYKFNAATSWSKAESDAVALGGHLAVINSKAENDFITTQPSINTSNLWIGLYKEDGVGSPFRWVNCDTIGYTNWATSLGAPVTGTTLNQVYIRGSLCTSPGEWFNTDENVVHPDPCESNFFGLVEFDPSYNISYLWNNGDTTVTTTITPTKSSIHNVQITQNGTVCFGSINVGIIDPNQLIDLDTMTECKASFMMIQAATGMTSYLWSTGSKNSFIFVSTSGGNRWYSVTAVTPEGCTGKDSVFVSIFNSNIRTPDTTICLGESITLRGPTPPFAYQPDYSQNFAFAPFAGWTGTTSINYNGSKVLGPFANDSIVYSIIDLPLHDSIRVTFDLFIHDTWEGDTVLNGPDIFRLKNGTTNLINNTFSNTNTCTQTYSGTPVPGTYPAKTGATTTGLPRRCDINGGTTLYTITKAFRHSSVNLDLSFVGDLQDLVDNSSLCNESWSLDNVLIEVRRPSSILWSTGDTTQNIDVTPVDPTTEYWVRVPVGGGYCYDTVLVTAVSGQIPGDMFFSDTARICGGSSFNMSMPNNYAKYNWSNGTTDRLTTIYNEGWYIGYVETSSGACYNSDSIYVSFGKARIVPSADTMVCYGNPFTIKADLNNDCSPFGAPLNTGYVPGQAIAGYTYKGEYRGHHYYLADVHSSWSIAAQNALQAGGHLANINDTAEQNFIAAVVDSNAWLGLWNSPLGYFIWMNCDTLTYTNWASGEPTPTPDDYVFMMSTGCPEAKKWDAHTDDDMSSADPCYSSIYGLLEIAPYQYTFDWEEDGVSIGNTDSITITPTSAKRYFGTVSKYPGDANCGIGSFNLTVMNESFGIIPDSISKLGCFGDTAMIEAKPGYSNYHWDNGDTTQVAVYNSTIGWAYCMYDNGTCKFTDSVYLFVPGKLVTLPTSTNITCYGSNDGIGNAGFTGGTPPFNIQWAFNGSSNPIESNLSPGVYYYSITDSIGCNAIDSITITNPDSALKVNFVLLSGVKCNSDTNAVVLAVPSGGEAPYTGAWFNGMPDTLWFVGKGIYSYTVTDARNCTFNTTDTVNEPNALDIIALQLKQIYCPEDSDGLVLLSATGGTTPYHFVWNFGLLPDDTARGVFQGDFMAYVVDTNFCYDSVAVSMVASNPEKCGLIVPSGFTPNNDGRNDLFHIKNLDIENELTIFNRWGEVVYHTTNYKNDWDGKPDRKVFGSSEDIVPNDTYFYVLVTKANNKTYTGYVYITK